MKNAHKFCHDPRSYLINSHRVLKIWIDIAPDVPNAPIIPDFVQRWQHSRNENTEATVPWARRIGGLGFECTACVHHFGGFRRLLPEGARDCTFQDGVNDLA